VPFVKLTDAKVTTADHVYKKTPEGELTLHGYFPPDWKARRAFYGFTIGEAWRKDMTEFGHIGLSRDPKALEPLVTSFAAR
jgi:hypothetical protein